MSHSTNPLHCYTDSLQACLDTDLQLCIQDKARLDITRLQRLSSGFGNFTTSGIRSTTMDTTAPALDDTSKEVLKIVFNRNGSYLQVIVCCTSACSPCSLSCFAGHDLLVDFTAMSMASMLAFTKHLESCSNVVIVPSCVRPCDLEHHLSGSLSPNQL